MLLWTIVSRVSRAAKRSSTRVFKIYAKRNQSIFQLLGLLAADHRIQGFAVDRVVEVIDHLLVTPEIEEPLRLIQPRVLYEFADPKLQKLSGGQKILLGMGPANLRKLKAKLREIRDGLVAMKPLADCATMRMIFRLLAQDFVTSNKIHAISYLEGRSRLAKSERASYQLHSHHAQKIRLPRFYLNCWGKSVLVSTCYRSITSLDRIFKRPFL